MTEERSRALTCVFAAAIVAALSQGIFAAPSGQDPPKDPQKYQVEVRLMFWGDESEAASVAGQEGNITDFFVRRARVIVQGKPSERVTFNIQVGQDFIGSKVAIDEGSIRIKDAYITYRAADALLVTAGQFKIPFLRANLESGFNQLLVDRGTLPSQRPAREGSRDLGAMAWGNAGGLQYRLAMFDGSDQETRNSRSHLRGSGRVAYNWFTAEPGLAYTGTYLGRNRVLQIAAQVDWQNSRFDLRDEAAFQSRARDYRAYALEAFFEQPFAAASALTLDGAWLDRQDDYVEGELPTRTLRGYYLQSGFLLPGHIGVGRLQFAVRREAWDVERGLPGANNTRTTVGTTYHLKDHNRKVQADFTRKRETPEISNDEWRVSAVLVF